MTRAMDTLVMTRARYRRRYGSDMPDASIPSRFLEEVPARLIEDLGSPVQRPAWSSSYGTGYGSGYGSAAARRPGHDDGERHYSYEDEDQTSQSGGRSIAARASGGVRGGAGAGSSMDNIASFFAARGQNVPGQKSGQRFSRPKLEIPEPTGKTGLKQGSRVRHPKYGEGTVFRREGDGDDAKITVQFQQHGVKKLVEKFAQLERI
jgi:DNA helicase-2/ATP-dependent DNA helicase PcrA